MLHAARKSVNSPRRTVHKAQKPRREAKEIYVRFFLSVSDFRCPHTTRTYCLVNTYLQTIFHTRNDDGEGESDCNSQD